MELVGYADRLSVRPGESIAFNVSATVPGYRAQLVRLIHGSERDFGPGFKERVVSSTIDGEYPGREQPVHTGSFVVAEGSSALPFRNGVTLHAWIFPTLPDRGHNQAVLTIGDPETGRGVGLFLDAAGAPLLIVRDDAQSITESTGVPLRKREWVYFSAGYDPVSGRVSIQQTPRLAWPDDPISASKEAETLAGIDPTTGAAVVIGALSADGRTRPASMTAHFNGKIDSPIIRGGDGSVLARWDFGADQSSLHVPDRGPLGLTGIVVNAPTRAVTGHNWSGLESNPRYAPAEYGAIHFHEDDLDDCRWETDFTLAVPDDLPSGIYAAKLTAGDAEEYIPFYVRPHLGRATANVAFLASTNTYLSYANEQGTTNEDVPSLQLPHANPAADERPLAYLKANKLLSQYDFHLDGSGVAFSSRLRPILNMRPKARSRHIDDPHAFPADLCLIDWLDHEGIAVDVFTDEDLHLDGQALLAPYKVVLSGSHPEYWSGHMLDALDGYLRDGGRHLYLGGNGYYWVTSYCPHRSHLIEVRRWGGTGSWKADPGEYHHGTTGELGGLWRNRGRAPQKLLGIGFTAQGFDEAKPYFRQPDSFDTDVAWIFDGVGADEPIGDQPNLILGHGAAGHEVDRFDIRFGTPAHTKLLATATGFSDSYQAVVEELLMSDSMQGGTVNPRVRADMTYLPYPNGGAVFSVGSIAWIGALSANGYDNPVARITGNVVRRFME